MTRNQHSSTFMCLEPSVLCLKMEMIDMASSRLKHIKRYLLATQEDLTGCTLLISTKLKKVSVLHLMTQNSLSIPTEDATEKLNFNKLADPDSDDDTPTEIVANDNNVNNVDDHGDGGGNIDNNGEFTSTDGESSRQLRKQLRGS